MDFFGISFQIINVMSIIMPVVVCGILIVFIVRNISQWSKNEKSPRLTVDAKVVAKRSAYRRTMSNKHTSGRNHTNYYATFQFESGDRLELELKGQEYGLLVEGDKGKLTFQGTRYLGFERT